LRINRCRSVSPIVSSIIMLLIALSISSIIYITLYTQVVSSINAMKQELLETKIKLMQFLDIGLAVINATNKTLYLIVATGQNNVELITIYVNNTYIGYDLDLTIPPNTLYVIRVDLSSIESQLTLSEGAIAYIKVIYEGGECYAFAEVVT